MGDLVKNSQDISANNWSDILGFLDIKDIRNCMLISKELLNSALVSMKLMYEIENKLLTKLLIKFTMINLSRRIIARQISLPAMKEEEIDDLVKGTDNEKIKLQRLLDKQKERNLIFSLMIPADMIDEEEKLGMTYKELQELLSNIQDQQKRLNLLEIIDCTRKLENCAKIKTVFQEEIKIFLEELNNITDQENKLKILKLKLKKIDSALCPVDRLKEIRVYLAKDRCIPIYVFGDKLIIIPGMSGVFIEQMRLSNENIEETLERLIQYRKSLELAYNSLLLEYEKNKSSFFSLTSGLEKLIKQLPYLKPVHELINTETVEPKSPRP